MAIKLQGVAIGVGIGIIVWLAAPAVKRNYRHASKTVAEGISEAYKELRKWVEIGKEEVTDILMEAQYERATRTGARELNASQPPPSV